MKKIELNEMDIALVKTALHRYKDYLKDMTQKTDDPYPFEICGRIITIINDIKTQTK